MGWKGGGEWGGREVLRNRVRELREESEVKRAGRKGVEGGKEGWRRSQGSKLSTGRPNVVECYFTFSSLSL